MKLIHKTNHKNLTKTQENKSDQTIYLPGQPTVSGFARQYSSNVWRAAHDKHWAVSALQQAGPKKSTTYINIMSSENDRIELPITADLYSFQIYVIYFIRGQPGMSGYVWQKSSMVWPASHERHWAVLALQQGLRRSPRTVLLRINKVNGLPV